MFLTPRSRLLQLKGTEIDCDPIVSAQFRIDGNWFSIGVSKHQVPEPAYLTVEPISTWTPHSIYKLATAGIYSYDEAEQLRSRLMNPYEREAISNIITRGVTGQAFDRQEISLNPLVDDDMVESLGERIKDKVWGFFKVFGNVSAGLLGIYFFCKTAKFLIDTAVHCKLLYEIYGFSVALVCGVWDSVTTYLVHKNSINTKEQKKTSSNSYSQAASQENDIPLTKVVTNNEMASAPRLHETLRSDTNKESGIYPRLPSNYSFTQP